MLLLSRSFKFRRRTKIPHRKVWTGDPKQAFPLLDTAAPGQTKFLAFPHLVGSISCFMPSVRSLLKEVLEIAIVPNEHPAPTPNVLSYWRSMDLQGSSLPETHSNTHMRSRPSCFLHVSRERERHRGSHE